MHNHRIRIGQWFQSAGRFFMRYLPGHKLAARKQRESQQSEEGLGPRGERLAAKFLRGLGYRIVARGHRQRLGEIDLIAVDQGCLVFVEVKTWASGSAGDPSEAVNRSKQEKITRAALVYLKKRGLLEHPARFDVISIVWPSHAKSQPSIRHFKNAFEAVGRFQMYR